MMMMLVNMSSSRMMVLLSNTSRKRRIRNGYYCFVPTKLAFISASGNLIAAAASSHGAVSSAITQVAVTAVAIASGACLSTQHDFLCPPKPPSPSPKAFIDGVDVTGFPVFNHPMGHKAIAFARNAHKGQLRKTGDPYLTHCINTAKILPLLVPTSTPFVGQM